MASTSSDLIHEEDGSDNSPSNDKTDGKETSSTNKHIEWAENVTLADFVVTNDNQSILSVKGEAIKKVSLKNLLAICAKYNKETVCALIAQKINASNVASMRLICIIDVTLQLMQLVLMIQQPYQLPLLPLIE